MKYTPHEIAEMDSEANYFAMHLLVPTAALALAVNELGGIDLAGNGIVERLAAQFQVSTNVIAFRLGEEGLLKL